jgi:hypothetical protein
MSTLVSSIITIKYQFISSYLAVTGQIVRSHDWKRKTSDYLKIQLATESVGVPRACWVCAWGVGMPLARSQLPSHRRWCAVM